LCVCVCALVLVLVLVLVLNLVCGVFCNIGIANENYQSSC
jgi:hypothetical protein